MFIIRYVCTLQKVMIVLCRHENGEIYIMLGCIPPNTGCRVEGRGAPNL